MFETFMQKTIEKHPEIKSLKKAKTMLVTGLPVTRTLEVAEKIDASMIVMGSQGRTGLKHIMLGSKAEQVVRLSQIPVTIVKATNI
jgi:nucleotide-binding universal stress UspA family protein